MAIFVDLNYTTNVTDNDSGDTNNTNTHTNTSSNMSTNENTNRDITERVNKILDEKDLSNILSFRKSNEYNKYKRHKSKTGGERRREISTELMNTNIMMCSKCNVQLILDEEYGSYICSKCGELCDRASTGDQEWLDSNEKSLLKIDERDKYFRVHPRNKRSTNIYISSCGGNYKVFKYNNPRSGTLKKMRNNIVKCNDIIKNVNMRKDIYNLYANLINEYKRIYRSNSMLCACIKYIADVYGKSIDMSLISERLGTTKSKITKNYNNLIKILQEYPNIYITKISPISSNNFALTYIDVLGVEQQYADILMEMLNNIKKIPAIKNVAKTITISCIYLISEIFQLGYTKSKLCSIRGMEISEVTIYKCYKELLGRIDEIYDTSKFSEKIVNRMNSLLKKRK